MSERLNELDKPDLRRWMAHGDNWFVAYRLRWISLHLKAHGYVNRKHLRERFRISEPQAAIDLQRFQKLRPHAMSYNNVTRRYEKNGS